jgi:CBS domain
MKAVEVMSPQVITISRDATIEDAARIMLHHGISGLHNGRLPYQKSASNEGWQNRGHNQSR